MTISERSRPPGPKVTAAPPPLTADDALAIRGKVVPIHKQQIELYQQLIASTPAADVDDLADAHFRLADLYLQDNRYHRLKATEATIAADRARGADRATLARAAKPHRAEAAAELREALEADVKAEIEDSVKFAEDSAPADAYAPYVMKGAH